MADNSTRIFNNNATTRTSFKDKKKCVVLLVLLIFAFSLLFCLTACDLYKKDEAPAIVVTSDILTIDDENMRMYANVSNSVMQFSLIDDIVVPEGVSVDFAEGEIYSQYAHKTVNLNEGANNFRIVFSNGEYEREYEVLIYRKKICEVRFDANNNTPVTVVKVEEGGIVDAPIVKKTGYTFDGWDIDITQPISQSVSTRAKWAANEYILTIDANGGETDVTEITAQYGNTLENVLPTLTRNGYVFASWRIKSTNELYYGGKWNIAHDDTLIAQWTPKFYSVTVENQLIGAADATDAGKIKGTTSYRIGATGTLTAVPTKGFDFVGWYDGNTLLTTNAEFSFPIEGVNLKFVAKFKVKIDGMEKFYFSTQNEVDDYIISGIRENNAEEIYVPDCVVSIEKGAFETARTSLKTYTAPFVGMSATENCNIRNIFSKNGEDSPLNLKTVTVTKAIGDYALYSTRVNEVIIGKDVSSIGEYAFCCCNFLVSVKGVENVKSIGGHAFEKCTGLVSIDGTENVLSIGEYAFSQCERLKGFTFNDEIKIIEEEVFKDCTALGNIVLPSSLKSICDYAFYNTGLYNVSLTLPDGLETIGMFAFNKSKAKGIFVPASVTSIGTKAFAEMQKLEYIEIKGSYDILPNYMFMNCSALQTLTFSSMIDICLI